MREDQEKFYNDSNIYFQTLQASDKNYFDEYISFVSHHVKGVNIKVLDIGCGTGQSTYFLVKAGYQTCGIDGSARFIEYAKSKHPDIKFFQADAKKLPFDSSSFDIVASYNTVEHFEDVEESIREMVRVAKRGGLVIVNSPNLLSLWHSINAIIKFKGETFEGKKNVFQIVFIIFRNLYLIIKKSLQKLINISYRQPNLNFNFPDNDATWYLNPVDLKKLFIKNKCVIVSYQSLEHIKVKKGKICLLLARLFPSIMGITRVVAKKL